MISIVSALTDMIGILPRRLYASMYKSIQKCLNIKKILLGDMLITLFKN